MINSHLVVKITSNSLKYLFVGLETKMNFGTSYHLQIDGKTSQTIQVIKEMLECGTCMRLWTGKKPYFETKSSIRLRCNRST